MASDGYHEPFDLLSPNTRDLHRGITTLIEELQAVDWYQQRAEACTDDDLKAVILHNKKEEIEHAMMTLEWLRRRSPEIDASIKTYLLTEGPITQIEKEKKAAEQGGAPSAAGGDVQSATGGDVQSAAGGGGQSAAGGGGQSAAGAGPSAAGGVQSAGAGAAAGGSSGALGIGSLKEG